MRKQIPRGDEELICPLHKATMDTVCHKCPLWVHIRGMNPNTGQEDDHWNCSLAWLPTLLIENSQQSRQTAASVDSFRNETVDLGNKIGSVVAAVAEQVAGLRDDIERNKANLISPAERVKLL